MNMMYQNELLQTVEKQESNNQCNHRPRRIDTLLMRHLKNLRQDFKAHDTQKYACREAKDEVQPIAKSECK